MTLSRIELADWRAVHSWASLPQVCRFQTWGPNTEEQTRAFVATAVDAWAYSPQQRFAYAARTEGDVVGMGELHVRSHHLGRDHPHDQVPHPQASSSSRPDRDTAGPTGTGGLVSPR
ncbi:GNAT family N-acetyltransferase [Streptomyces sp. NPDC096193]|uniref:GNAT family N-acetyltransferase n=1 Tax=Streptomyces sp. NPDC096193 TaxID=3155821 RepID=UPI00332CB5B6